MKNICFIYMRLIKKGLLTLDQVPLELREEIKKILEEKK